MMPTPTQADLEARNAAAAAGRRIEAAREQGGDAAADAERDAIRAELGLPPLGTATATRVATTEGLTARVTTQEAAVVAATADDDEGVEFVGMTMGGEPLPDAVTEADTPAPVDGRQPYEAPVLTPLGSLRVDAEGNVDLGTLRVNGAAFHQPTKVTGEDRGFAVVEKDGPAQLTFTPDFVQDGMATALFALNRLGAFRAGERASEDGPIKPHEVRVLWFCGAFRPYSADWSGSEAFNRAQQFADALRKAGLTDVAVTNHPGVQIEPETGGEGVQTAEEAPEGMQAPEQLARACGATEWGLRSAMDPLDPTATAFVDWRTTEAGVLAMRALFPEQRMADAFTEALLARDDIGEVTTSVQHGFTMDDETRAQLDAAMERLRDHLQKAFAKARRRQAIKLAAIQCARTFLNGVLFGFGILAAFAIAGVVMGLAR